MNPLQLLFIHFIAEMSTSLKASQDLNNHYSGKSKEGEKLLC